MNRILSMFLLLSLALYVKGQEELNIGDVFEGKFVHISNKTETYISGKPIEKHKLDLLRTLKFEVPEKERNEVERLFRMDMKEKENNQEDNMEMENRNGHIYYAVVQLHDFRGRHRYICYQCRKVGKEYSVSLAYIRGKATMNELRKMFKK